MPCDVIPPLNCQDLTFTELVDYVNELEQRRFELCELVENFDPPTCVPDQPIEQFSVSGLTAGDWPSPAGYPGGAGEYIITLANSYDLSKTYVFDRGELADDQGLGQSSGYFWQWFNVVGGFSNQIRFIADTNLGSFYERLEVSVMQSEGISTQHIDLTATGQNFSVVTPIAPFTNIDNVTVTNNARGRLIRTAGGNGSVTVSYLNAFISGTSAAPILTVSGFKDGNPNVANFSVQVLEFGG